VSVRGKIVARIVPASQPTLNDEGLAAVWAEMDELAAEIGASWPATMSSTEAIDEVRRAL
jgi:hypothetical protein